MVAVQRWNGEHSELRPWQVLVDASGGWLVLAELSDENFAWEFANRMLDARISKAGECIGHKTYPGPWTHCDGSGPCGDTLER